MMLDTAKTINNITYFNYFSALKRLIYIPGFKKTLKI